MLNFSRDRNELTDRSWAEEGGPAMRLRVRVTPGRERESSARIMNGMKGKKKLP